MLTSYLYINLRRSRDCLLCCLGGCVSVCVCVRACVRVLDPRFIQFTLGSCYT